MTSPNRTPPLGKAGRLPFGCCGFSEGKNLIQWTAAWAQAFLLSFIQPDLAEPLDQFLAHLFVLCASLPFQGNDLCALQHH